MDTITADMIRRDALAACARKYSYPEALVEELTMRRRIVVAGAAVLMGLGLVGVGGGSAAAGAPPPAAVAQAAGSFDFTRPDVVATGLEVPWGMTFLPDGSALVAERNRARIVRLRPGAQPVEAARVPGVVPGGEGGLLGIAVSPTFSTDNLVYAYFTAAADNRIVRFRLDAPGTPQVVLAGLPKASIHNGGRIAFGPDGNLYAGAGDAGQTANAQNQNSLGGKILRMRPDGTVPPGNPFGTLVYSLGHRNVQGLAWDGQGRLWATEFGQNAFDEVNVIVAGGNYGWPIVEGRGTDSRFVNPVVVWTTAEASPSGAAIAGDTLFAAALGGRRLWSVPLNGTGGVGTPTAELTGTYGRLRTVTFAPDGWLWVTTSNRDGRGTPAATDDRVLRFPPLVTVPPATNLALNRPATGSASCAAAESPAKAVNGSVSGGNGDKWCSAVSATKFLQVDLGSAVALRSVTVRHAQAGGESAAYNTRDFDLQVSTDGTTFTTAAQVRGNTAAVSTHAVTASARYVRLNVITPAQDGNQAARIYELEVFG
jgi:glucose/arabinose dehydrogenase